MTRRRQRSGMTLIEVLAALAILGIGLAVLIQSVARCLAVVHTTRNYETARYLLQRLDLEHPLGVTDPIVAGQLLTLTYTVSNAGPDTATSVLLNAYLDGSSQFVGAAPSQGSASRSGNTCTASLGALAANATATLTITAIPLEAGIAYNSATVGCTESDSVTANNSTAQETTVQAGAGVFQF